MCILGLQNMWQAFHFFWQAPKAPWSKGKTKRAIKLKSLDDAGVNKNFIYYTGNFTFHVIHCMKFYAASYKLKENGKCVPIPLHCSRNQKLMVNWELLSLRSQSIYFLGLLKSLVIMIFFLSKMMLLLYKEGLKVVIIWELYGTVPNT